MRSLNLFEPGILAGHDRHDPIFGREKSVQVTPHEPQKRSRRTLTALLLAVFGAAVALGGIALLRSTAPSNSTPRAGESPSSAAAAKAEGSDRPLSARAVYDVVSPSVVDITATLGYDDETASGTGFFVDP